MTKRSATRRHDFAASGWSWVRQILYRIAVPGGLLLLVAGVLGATGVLSGPAVSGVAGYCPYVVFAAGLLLSAVFRRSRLFFSFLVLALAQSAVAWIIPAQGSLEVRRVMLDAVGLLLPINLVALAFTGDKGIVSPAGRTRMALIALQAFAVATLSWPSLAHAAASLDKDFLPARLAAWSVISSSALVVFVVAAIVFVVGLARKHRPVESSMAWSMAAAFLALQADGANGLAAVYFSTAGLVLMIAVVETSYAMAYRDELTQLPSRRALNEALLQMGSEYTIAMVDVDHFKKFNDTYGHEAGDHALRLVAARLSHVTGGGRAYRYGGEEFAVLFPGKSAEEAGASLDRLRRTIEQSSFVVRGQDRRKKGRGWRNGEKETRVTVSIGLAERTDDALRPHDVLKLADKALYRAKAKGRNCTVAARRSRAAQGTRALAS
ncbi:MAG TPA: GGDEF domain-containing protein [Candidatus Angelobacter sp.]|nr:GGDEF domain-containing protein [Candidatus Angelobacter sp.]